MANELTGKILLAIIAIGSLILGLKTFNIHLVEMIVPQYTIWIYRGIGIVGGFVLYSTFKKK